MNGKFIHAPHKLENESYTLRFISFQLYFSLPLYLTLELYQPNNIHFNFTHNNIKLFPDGIKRNISENKTY